MFNRTELIEEMRQILAIKDDPKTMGARCTTFLHLMNQMTTANSVASADEIREHLSALYDLDALATVSDKVFPMLAIKTLWMVARPKTCDLTDTNSFKTFANFWNRTLRELYTVKE